MLIISPTFPPKSTPDLQRVRMSLPYYRENGWEPIVLTVAAADVEAPDEPALLETVPVDVAVYRCHALSPATSRRVGLGNLGWRAWWSIAWTGARLIREHHIDLVFFSTTQFALLPLGRIWKAVSGIPFVVDLQDPWRTDYYERPGVRRPPGGWKYQAARAQAALLEPWSFHPLAGLITVSADYLRDLRMRYSWFRPIPAATIGFGASEHDLTAAVAMEPKEAEPISREEQNPSGARLIHLVYTGASGPIIPHAVSVLFAALRNFRATTPEQAARLRLHFIGTSYAPADQAKLSILPLAESFGLADLVDERASRVGHLECIRAQAKADVLLLLGSSDRAYSPSKIYPYFLAKRPIVAVVFRESVLEKLLQQLGGAVVANFSENDTTAAQETLVTYFTSLTQHGAVLPSDRNEMYFNQHYLARTLTAQQAQLFDRALDFARADVVVL
ncbi:MAG TPA: hypothetical protein VIM69_09210 [Opitutaceae bacterium]